MELLKNQISRKQEWGKRFLGFVLTMAERFSGTSFMTRLTWQKASDQTLAFREWKGSAERCLGLQ